MQMRPVTQTIAEHTGEPGEEAKAIVRERAGAWGRDAEAPAARDRIAFPEAPSGRVAPSPSPPLFAMPSPFAFTICWPSDLRS